MIISFSGTGNSLYVAQRIAAETKDTLIDLNMVLHSESPLSVTSDGNLILVTPTYAWRIPHIVREWLKNNKPVGAERIWFVMTCGGQIGGAGKYNKQLASSLGLQYMGTVPIIMPENYIAMFNVPSSKESMDIIDRSEADIQGIISLILESRSFPADKCSLMDSLLSSFNPFFYSFCVHSKAFMANDNCISCGKCVNNCPLSNIHLSDGKPVWGTNCTHCMACICRCPSTAIEYGKKSIGKSRYYCPKLDK